MQVFFVVRTEKNQLKIMHKIISLKGFHSSASGVAHLKLFGKGQRHVNVSISTIWAWFSECWEALFFWFASHSTVWFIWFRKICLCSKWPCFDKGAIRVRALGLLEDVKEWVLPGLGTGKTIAIFYSKESPILEQMVLWSNNNVIRHCCCKLYNIE